AYWQDYDPVEGGPFELTNNSTFQATVSSQFDAFCTMTIEALDNIIEFSLISETNGTGFTFSDFDFTSNSVLVVSNEQSGLFVLNNLDKSRSIVDGGPVFLSSGVN